MSKNKNSKQSMILFGLMALILVSVIINVKPENYQENLYNEEPRASIILDDDSYEPLIINSNEELELLNFSGTGESWDNPYIIEDLSIISNSSHFAISLNNITKYVLIQQCDIYLTTPYRYNSSYGILINNSANIAIDSCFFHENSLSYSRAIYLHNSEDILIKNNFIDYFAEGIGIVSSKNCTIEENNIDYIIKNGISIEKSEDITVFNNEYKGRYKYGWRPDGTGIRISHSTSIKIQSNQFSFLETCIYLINVSKITIFENKMDEGNVVKGISGYEVFDCEIFENIIEDTGIYFDFSSGISIIENTISRSDIAIELYNVNSTLIESNSILYPERYAFEIIDSSNITIKLNYIRGVSLSIFSPDSTMKLMQFNYIIPSFSYIILGIALLSIFILFSIVYINFKKQSEKITAFQTVHSKLQNTSEIENDLKDNQINGDNLKLFKSSSKFLLDYEKLVFRKFCARIYLILGILIPLSLGIIIYPRSLSGDFLRFINGDKFINETWILHVISNLFLIISWLFGVLFVYGGAKKVLPQKIFKDGLNLQKKEKIISAVSIGIYIILWFLYYFLSMRYGFILGLAIIGISCCLCFIPILYLPFKHKWMELPIIGVILIMVSLITYLNIDYSTLHDFNLFKGIRWAYWLLFIGSSIVVWITALDKYESINSEPEISQIQ